MASERNEAASPPVPRDLILVHGLWFRAAFLWRLRARLRAAGYRVHSFSYASTRVPPEHNVARLEKFCLDRAPSGAHLLGHSLGGLLILLMLQSQQQSQAQLQEQKRAQGGEHGIPRWHPGRIVLLGTPLHGSSVARQVRDWPGGHILLGQAGQLLGRGHRELPANLEIGMLAGKLPRGLGRITGTLAEPSDGTVAIAETQVAGLGDHLILPVTHTSMLYAAEVARQAVEFLRKGQFDHGS